MKIFLTCTITLFVLQSCFAGLTVNMLSQQDTVVSAVEETWTYRIDFENDGVNDVEFEVVHSIGHSFISISAINSQPCEINQLNINETIAYSCGANMTATNDWDEQSVLAASNAQAQFGGQGPRYVAFRKNGKYGWVKVACSQDGTQLIVYGWAHSDVSSTVPNVRAGEGECVTSTAIDELQLPANIISTHNSILTVTYSEPLLLYVSDIQGRLSAEINFEGGKKEYDLSPFDAGLYLVEVMREGKRKTFKLFL